ncbi:MAG: efflux RND transporter permease subunit [Hyphomicrobiales bacterium]
MTEALEVILRRPKTVLTMMLFMLAAGILTYVNIPKEANPDIDVPVFAVSVTQQGISPQDAERLLVRPLETQLRGLDGLKEITAVAFEGAATATLEFDVDFDKDKALADIRDKVDQAQAEFPPNADEAVITETNFSLQPTIFVTLSGDVPERALHRHAKRLQDEIESISTVREANLLGTRDELMEVIIDLEKLESYNISQTELVTAVTANNQLVEGGFLDTDGGRFALKVPGLVEDAEDVTQIPIRQIGDAVITLGDVAELRRTFKDASSTTRVNGKPAIAIAVVKRIGQNIIDNNAEVRTVVEEFSKDWPKAIKIDFVLDQSNFIFEVLGSLEASILTAIFLVMIVVVATLGVKSSLLVGFSIPLSFMVGFLILSLSGYTVNIMVMFGLVLTVGLLVDGAIVMTEYADRKMSEGMSHNEAYIRAAKLMFWPIVSSTATTLAAFLPLLLWPGVPGEFMSYLPIMVIIVLSASLLTAMVFLPASGALLGQMFAFAGRHSAILLSLLMAALAGTATYLLSSPILSGALGIDPAIQMQATIVATALVALIVAMAIYPLASWSHRRNASKPKIDETAELLAGTETLQLHKLKGATGFYARTINLLANNLLGNIAVLVVTIAICAITFVQLGERFKGVEFFVDEEPDQAIVFVSARGNLSAKEASDIVGEVEEVILNIPGIRAAVMTASSPTGAGSGGGGVGGGTGEIQDKPRDAIGEISLELGDYKYRPSWKLIQQQIRVQTAQIPGIKVEPKKIEGGPPTGKDVRLEIKSTDYDKLVLAVGRVRGFLDQQVDLLDTEDGRPLPGATWELTIDREQAARHNATVAAIGAMVQLVSNGVLIGTYRPSNSDEEVDIRVRLPKEQRTLSTLDDLRLRTESGLVPLSNFITREAKPKVSSITRRDGLYAMDVKANLKPGTQITVKTGSGEEVTRAITADDKVGQVQKWLDDQTWDPSIQFRFRGADEEQKESGEFLTKAMIGSLFLMFIILLTQFNSFYQSILTLATVILAVFGALIGMMVTGQKFSIIMTGTGIIALAGIVVNNAIVLLDTYNRMRSEGINIPDAVVKTAAQRLRPILLTTVTTIAGLVPMATQINLNFFERVISVGSITSIWWVQLSTAIIAGLAFSTLLTLILIPCMLALPHNVVMFIQGAGNLGASAKEFMRGRKRISATAAHEPEPEVRTVREIKPQMAATISEAAE